MGGAVELLGAFVGARVGVFVAEEQGERGSGAFSFKKAGEDLEAVALFALGGDFGLAWFPAPVSCWPPGLTAKEARWAPSANAG